jgi:hypothetical protein
MTLNKADISLIAELLEKSHETKYAEILATMSRYMCHDDKIVIDTDLEIVTYEHG